MVLRAKRRTNSTAHTSLIGELQPTTIPSREDTLHVTPETTSLATVLVRNQRRRTQQTPTLMPPLPPQLLPLPLQPTSLTRTEKRMTTMTRMAFLTMTSLTMTTTTTKMRWMTSVPTIAPQAAAAAQMMMPSAQALVAQTLRSMSTLVKRKTISLISLL